MNFYYDDFYNTLKALSDPNSNQKIQILSENELKNI
jgi:hypothetical protein